MFWTISAASVSANTSTTFLSSAKQPHIDAPDGRLLLHASRGLHYIDSFSSVSLQPVPRGAPSGPLSGPIDRGFLSGSIERGFISDQIHSRSLAAAGIFSGSIDSHTTAAFQRSFSHDAGYGYGGVPSFCSRSCKLSAIMRGLKRAMARTISHGRNSIVAPINGDAPAGFFSGGEDRKIFLAAATHARAGETGEFVIDSCRLPLENR